MKKQHLILSLFALGLTVNLLIGFRVFSNDEIREGEDIAFEKIAVMMRVLHLIRQDYVEAESADYENLLNNAIHGMVGSLDPHSSYLELDDFQDMVESTEGEFGGIGALITIRDNALTVIAPMEDTPGARAGLLPGDRIIEIDGVGAAAGKLEDSVRQLRGEPGTTVTLTIQRDDQDPFDVVIERAIIEVPSVKNACVLNGGTGYIRLLQFDEKTAPGLQESLKELASQGMTSLILDLRNNPGGLLTSAVEVSSFFLPKGKLVVSTEGRRPSQVQRYETGGGDKYGKIPMMILVNGGSASASEIVAGCLKDWERAVLIGEKTFGKGSVQSVIELPDGGALRLTTAKYYTPSRVVIHDRGIEPDISVEMSEKQLENLIMRQRGVEGKPVDPEVDPQLARALEAIESFSILQGKRKVDPEEQAEKREAEEAQPADEAAAGAETEKSGDAE